MIQRRVEKFLTTHAVRQDSSLLIGYSGGPDSTCLLASIKELSAKFNYSLAAAYVDHGIRPEAERAREREHVQRFVKELGVPLYIKEINQGELRQRAREGKLGLEEAARNVRKAFFKELKARHGFQYLLLGHTLDDQIETVTMRLFQGAGAGGLRGIAPKRGWIVRPLIGCTRAEISSFLNEKKIEAFTDSTNLESDYLRNKVRQSVVPVLKRIFPGLGRSLQALSVKMASVDSFMRESAQKSLCWEKTANGVKLDEGKFFSAPSALRMYSLYGEFVKLMKGTPGRRKASLPFRFIAPLLRQEARKKERVLAQGCGIIIRRQGKSLFYERDIVSNGKIGYFIEVKLGVPFALADHQYILDMVSEENTKTDDYICAFNAQKVVPPLIIRSRKEGDKIDLGFGRKRLKKLFNDWKVGTDEKERIPIVTDGMGVLAVLGFMAGYPNVVRRGAEVKDVENADKALIFCRIAE